MSAQITIRTLPRDDREMSAEQALYTAVVEQAIRDLEGPNFPLASESWSFLTDRSGAWARSRRDICDCIGVDPDKLRENVMSTRRVPVRGQKVRDR